MISFTIKQTPVAQPRHRTHVLTDKAGNVIKGSSGQAIVDHYIPKDNPVHLFKYIVSVETRKVIPKPLIECCLVLTARFFLPRPQWCDAMVGRGKERVPKYPPGALRHRAKPDLDNLLKSLKDAMTGIAWKDDSQVVEYGSGTGKFYHENGGEPRVEIMIEKVDINPEQTYVDEPDRHPEYEEVY